MAKPSKGSSPKEAEPKREQISVRILEIHRERLRALAQIRDQHEYLVLEDALEAYWEALPQQDKTDAEAFVEIKRRAQAQKGQP
jgi:hypothetical protein